MLNVYRSEILKEMLREADALHTLRFEARRRQSLFWELKERNSAYVFAGSLWSSSTYNDLQNYKGLFVVSNITALISVRTYTVLIYFYSK